MNIKGNLYWAWKKLSERNLRKHYSEHYKREIEHYHQYAEKKSKSLMKREMKVLHQYWGCYPFQYIRYGMYKKSCTLSIQQMKDYIPNYFAYYLFFPEFYKNYLIISDDKELTYRIFESANIPQPITLIQFKNQLFYNSKKDIINDPEVNEIISRSSSKSLFFKPTLGLGGRGIWVFNKENEIFKDKEGHALNADLIRQKLSKDDNYILQEGIIQHKELNKIYPKAVNTFRIMTKTEKGKVKIMFAMLRMGQGGNQLDNASLSGLVCKINIKTGEFDELGITGLQKTLTEHPDSKFKFKGYVFPYWDEIVSFITIAAQKIDDLGYIGWDLAYSESGPLIIEVNAGAGLEYLQDAHGGVREAYEIKNPKAYWYRDKFHLKTN
jgi:hypothetical protein